MARRGGSAAGIGGVIVLGVVLAPFIWAYDVAGIWGIVGFIGIPVLLILVWLWSIGRQPSLSPSTQLPTSIKPYTSTYSVQSTPQGKTWSPGPPPMKRKAASPVQAWQTTLGLGFEEIDRLISVGNWDSARAALQRIAYGMVNADSDTKANFTAAMSKFAELDPLFSDVLAAALPVIEETPGIKQADLYRDMSDDKKELVRYVLYFAAELGKLVRVKKGNSYSLYPSGYIPAPEKVIKPICSTQKASPNTGADRRALMRERREQMLLSKERRPIWQLRAVGDGRDPKGCPGNGFPAYRWDDPFWAKNGPWACRRSECRCSVRAYQEDEEIMTMGK